MRKGILFFMLTIAVSLYGYAQQTNAGGTTPLLAGQWSVEKANEWYAKQAWIVGCNFLPSTAVNDVEMWQDETFDLPTIDKELALAKDWGINSVRVFLNYVVWEAEAKKFKSNFKKFLDVAEKHGISVMPILFDDCNFSGNVAKVGKQQDPVPGVHNSGWVSSPPATMVRDEAQWKKLKAYEQDMVRTFGKDSRIIIWDLYNEPGASDSKIKAELLEKIFDWAREAKPNQPLTVGAFGDWDGELSKLMRNHSDIVSFHSYGNKAEVEKIVQWAHSTGRPAVCTEWLRRQAGNTVQNILPLFESNRTGCYNWGLVEGRTQTYFHWGSRKDSPKPAVWQHDLIREDGTPYSSQEYQLFREMRHTTGVLKQNPRWTTEKANDWYAAAGWFNGVNYIPSDAINYTAMWDKTSFNPELIDRELALAEELGFNCVRVVLQHAVYADDPSYFLQTLDRFLAICAKHRIRVMPSFFDDCAFGVNTDPVVGKQPEPLIGWYAWAWSPSPGHTMVIDERYHPQLEKYVKDVMRKFKDDERIFLWDLYNEPTNGGIGDYSLPLVRKVFAWAREINPVQPLTVGVFNGNKKLNPLILENSDVISYHNYSNREEMSKQIAELKQHGRPVVCSEWLKRDAKSTIEDIMPLLKDENVGSMLWGLVNGKTQTNLPWGHRPEKLPYTGEWQCDLFRNDFTPYRESEIALIKKLNGKYNRMISGQFFDPAARVTVAGGVSLPGLAPGEPAVVVSGSSTASTVALDNAVLGATFEVGEHGARLTRLENKQTSESLAVSSNRFFAMTLANDTVIGDSDLTLIGSPVLEDIAAAGSKPRVADKSAGKQVRAVWKYTSADVDFELVWTVELRHNSNSFKQEFAIRPTRGTLSYKQTTLLDLAGVTGARVNARDDGNPVIAGGVVGRETFFLGLENPISRPSGSGDNAVLTLRRVNPLAQGESAAESVGIGVSLAGQLRRSFGYYVERERAHERRTFLHYQSWLDLKAAVTIETVVNSADLIHAISMIGSEFAERGVKIDGFVVDDGWDYIRWPSVHENDANLNVWDFDPAQFPTGFKPHAAEAAKYGASMGAWFGPSGGYLSAKATRLALNASKDVSVRYETNGAGFSLGGTRYYAKVRERVFDMIDNHGVRYFKFDGAGAGCYQTGPNDNYLADYEAWVRLMREMRAYRPDVYINATSGTYGSPYWLWYADAIWRDGIDYNLKESNIIRNTNYVDGEAYRNLAVENPLFPISSLMTCGFHWTNLDAPQPSGFDMTREAAQVDLKRLAKAYWSSGVGLQELYIRHTLVDASTPVEGAETFWDIVAANAKWARDNERLLTDAHYVGGNPRTQVYGIASWSAVDGGKGILMLRNPNSVKDSITIDPAQFFELPDGYSSRYKFVERDGEAADFVADSTATYKYRVTLEPYEVLVFEASCNGSIFSASTVPCWKSRKTKYSTTTVQ